MKINIVNQVRQFSQNIITGRIEFQQKLETPAQNIQVMLVGKERLKEKKILIAPLYN